MIITTTNTVEKHNVTQYLGIVNANVVLGTNFFSDFAAALTDTWGGRSGTYQNKLKLIYRDVMNELEGKARELNANAILGLHIDFDEISGGGKSMFMVSASGTAVILEKEFKDDRYAMYKLLSDVHGYWEKGFLSEEEFEYEKKRIISNYRTSITSEVKVLKDIQEDEIKKEKELAEKIEEAKKTLKTRSSCSEESIRSTTEFQIKASDYNSIPYDMNDSLAIIVAKFIRLNKIPEACKYYIDDTGLSYNDAIEFVVDIYKKIDFIDKDEFDRLLRKLKVLKSKGFIEQAVNEYKKYSLTDSETALEFINGIQL
jgi:uncharacterized protein YbjQ (UPF0145 family)